MKKFLALLTATALAFGALAGCNTNEKTTAETTASALLTQAPQVVTEEATVPPSVAETSEVNTTAKPEDPKREERTVKESTPEALLSDPAKTFNAEVKVDKEEVKKTVLAHAGLNEAEVKFYKAELDRERGGLVYEVEFDAGKYEYDYEVDAETGKVLKAEKEFRD